MKKALVLIGILGLLGTAAFQISNPGSSGTVASVGLTVNGSGTSGIFAVTGSPVTGTGTLDVGLTGNSGGIPYFSSSTVESSSAALTANSFVLGGGAAVAPLTSADYTVASGQIIAGSVGGNAGSFKALGTTSGSWALNCNPTTTCGGGTTTAPFVFGKLTSGTAGSTLGYVDLSGGYTTSAMASQSTATCTNVTNMTWAVLANKRYILSCEVPITLAASATVQFCLGGPGTATGYSLEADGPIGAAGAYAQISTLAQTAYGTKTTASSAVGAAEWIHVKANIQNGSTASGTNLTLQTAANGTNNITVGQDASCTLTQTN